MVKFHCLVKILINGNLFMESCKSNLQTMEYYKISENLKYACLSSKLQSIKTHPNTVNLNKQGTRQGTVNTSLRHKFGIPSCPQPGEQVKKQCPTTACSPVPRISSPS